jgi:Domain of unknown function (DU1801)
MPDILGTLLEGHTAEVGAILRRAREVTREELPGSTEQLDLPDHLIAYGYGSAAGVRSRDFLVALIPHKAHLNVQLADGATLPDPRGIVEGTGKRIRHVKCRSVADAERPELRALIRAQASSRG